MADNLVLGRGKLFFNPYPAGATTGGVRGFFGNVPTIEITQNDTELAHYSSQQGLKVKDRSVILQSDMTVNFTLDDINLGNVTLWFGGDPLAAAPSDAPVDLGTMAIAGKQSAIYGALTYESDNPIGDNLNYWFPYVNLRPNGNFGLIADTWQTMGFICEALKRDTDTERMYAFAPDGGVSTAPTDAAPKFTPDSAGVTAHHEATGGSVTEADTSQAATVAFDVDWTLTGGDIGVLRLWNGTVFVGSNYTVTGASGTTSVTFPATATGVIRLYNHVGGTLLASSASITVS